jgi:hypothetical protein
MVEDALVKTDLKLEEEKVSFTDFNQTELLVLLQNFSNLRTGQDQVLWSIIGSFWTANSVLLVSIFSTNHNIYKVGFIVSLVGITISWIWNFIQNRAIIRIESYENSIKIIERKLNIDYSLCAFSIGINDKESTKQYTPARLIMRMFSKYAIVFWCVSSLFLLATIILRK